MPYPDNCIKGIQNESLLIDGKLPSIQLFPFSSAHPRDREDHMLEESVNWRDNDDACVDILARIKRDKFQFQYGLAFLSTEELDRIKRSPYGKGFFKFERDARDENPYHGNLLLLNKVDNARKDAIRHMIAMMAVSVTHSREELAAIGITCGD